MITRDTDGNIVTEGQEIVNFRGEVYVFVRASRLPEVGRSGKVIAHAHPEGPSLEFYDRVFNLTITEE